MNTYSPQGGSQEVISMEAERLKLTEQDLVELQGTKTLLSPLPEIQSAGFKHLLIKEGGDIEIMWRSIQEIIVQP